MADAFLRPAVNITPMITNGHKNIMSVRKKRKRLVNNLESKLRAFEIPDHHRDDSTQLN